jgi:FkbM family methyltransferase
MKSAVKYILHKLFGFKNYLFVFSLFKIYTLKRDKNEMDFFHFLSLIPENTIVLDIGANIGIMTVHLARSIKNVKVISFEPMPNNIVALKRIVRHFKLDNVTIFECALGNTEGIVEMVMPVVDSVRMQGLSHVMHSSISENNEGERVTVSMKVLDKIAELTHSEKRISAIKIDVENFEYFVLDGAKALLKQNKPIVYAELWENENREKCFDLFKELNYSTFVISQNKMVVFDRARHKTQNFIFLPA